MFRKTSTKIVIGIVVITTSVLVIVSYVVFFRTKDEFRTTVYHYSTLGNGLVEILTPQDDERAPTPFGRAQKDFNDKLTIALAVGAISGVLLSLVAGSIFSKIITRPLNHLKNGIKQLRETNNKTPLSKTGEEEFDDVVDEFNVLVKELDFQENLRNNLIADVAHELKTPITALSGQLQAVRDGVFKLDENRINILISEMDRLTELTDSLNDFTRLQSLLPNIEKTECNLYEIIEEIKVSFEANLLDKKITLINSVPQDFKFTADCNLMKRVLSNLIDNAIFYSEGTTIKVGVDGNKIIVEDDGIGIDDNHRDHIFERFYRVEKSRNRKTGGLGLGLSIVKEVVEAHGGKIYIEPTDKGTKFVIET